MGRGIQHPPQSDDDQILRIKVLELVTKLPITSGADFIGVAQNMFDWVKNNPTETKKE